MRMATVRLAVSALCAFAAHFPAVAQESGPPRGVRILGAEPMTKPPTSGVPGEPAIDPATVRTENTAGLSIEVLPQAELPVGSRVKFRISSRKPGYLVLVDVDASGKLRQIYPSATALLSPDAGSEVSNRIKANETIMVPPAGAEYIVSPPLGVAMIVAILGDRPVQVLDLPDLPPNLVGHREALTFLTNSARTLRIAQAGIGRLAQPTWSFDAKFYTVK
jgi:hypothetical protein